MPHYFVSLATRQGKLGAIVIEAPESPDIRVTRIDSNGEDVKELGVGKYHSDKELEALHYGVW